MYGEVHLNLIEVVFSLQVPVSQVITEPTRALPDIDGLTVYEGAARLTDVAACVDTPTPDLILSESK